MTLHLNNLCHSLDLGNSLFKSSYITERSSYLVKPGTHLRLLPKPATNHEQSRLSPIWSTLSPIPSTLPPIPSTLLPVLVTNRQQLKFDSFSRSTLSPTLSLIWLTLLLIQSTLMCMGPKRRGRLCRLSTKLTMFYSTLSPVCTGLNSSRNFNIICGCNIWLVMPQSKLLM